MSELPIAELLEQFRSGELPKETWTHRAHIRVALAYLEESEPGQVMRELREGIQRLNLQHGVYTTPENGYHETRTRVWVAVLASLLQEGREPTDIVDSLARRDVVRDYYSQEMIQTWESRIAWVEPDLNALPLDPSGWGAREPELFSFPPEC